VNKKLLNVGCGSADSEPFAKPGWEEIRLDIDPNVKPNIVASITAIPLEDNSVDGLFSSHNLEHLYAHEVSVALKEFLRVLRPGTTMILKVPDVRAVAEKIVSDDLDHVLYTSPSGPIMCEDVLYGFGVPVASGNGFYAHKTGFSQGTMQKRLTEAGFEVIGVVTGYPYELQAVARKPKPPVHFTRTTQGLVATPPQPN